MYVLDEEKLIVGGTWEGYLDHEEVNPGSIMIFTGMKLTGHHLTGYSVIADGKKTKLRVSGASGTVYITYETSASLTAIPASSEIETPSLEGMSKADKLYVDAELAKKADKANTFTKREVLQKIEENGGNISVIDGGSFV